MTDTAKRLGYGGSGVVDDVQVLVTAAGLNEAISRPYGNMVEMPPTTQSESRVLLADGTSAFTGTIGFDVTQECMSLFNTSRLFQRRYGFGIGYNDGEDEWVLRHDGSTYFCFANSIALNGAPGGFVQASISVTANRPIVSDTVPNDFIRDQTLLGYWWSGNTDVCEWDLTISQNVVPVYVNQDTLNPRYLRVGAWDVTLNVTTLEQLQAHSSVSIFTSTFILIGETTAKGYNFGGQTELGTYTHTFDANATFAGGGSNAVIII